MALFFDILLPKQINFYSLFIVEVTNKISRRTKAMSPIKHYSHKK